MAKRNSFWSNMDGDTGYAEIAGWRIETYETNGTMLAQRIKSPTGRTATARWIGHDGRLSQLRTEANVEFASLSLKLTDALVDRMILAAEDYVARQVAKEPEFALTQV